MVARLGREERFDAELDLFDAHPPHPFSDLFHFIKHSLA